ncbi:hypothetical protein [Bacillus sp. JCM 19034]|uniref:hypothetical protein n=1 Tax=Bacillus sp. JCM 19034 TaxID=1481928 RepID=UPI0007846215|nr:hypothetical protein [Bacillus sp. JCM 19034]
MIRKNYWALFILIVLIISGCSNASGELPDSDLVVKDEQGNEVTLVNKERATILFHFTEVG